MLFRILTVDGTSRKAALRGLRGTSTTNRTPSSPQGKSAVTKDPSCTYTTVTVVSLKKTVMVVILILQEANTTLRKEEIALSKLPQSEVQNCLGNPTQRH
jgi:hypothetical protein